MAFKMTRWRKKPLERLGAVHEFLRLGNEPIGFNGIAKAVRRLFLPAIERAGRGQTVEAVIDFNRVEVGRIIFEPALLRQVVRIEAAAPMFVDPAGTADPNRLHEGYSCALPRSLVKPANIQESCVKLLIKGAASSLAAIALAAGVTAQKPTNAVNQSWV